MAVVGAVGAATGAVVVVVAAAVVVAVVVVADAPDFDGFLSAMAATGSSPRSLPTKGDRKRKSGS